MSVAALSASEKVPVTVVAGGDAGRAAAGTVAVTVGGVVSAVPPHVILASAQSPWS